MTSLCLQEQYAPHNACFGCGPANTKGLRIRSFVKGNEVVATWKPEPHHEAFPGILNGGIIGALLDCHCNWTAAHHLMTSQKLKHPPCTVTADYAIVLKRPCPTDSEIKLVAKVIETNGNKVTVEGTLECAEKIRATCRGTFVAVEEGHPAYHRW